MRVFLNHARRLLLLRYHEFVRENWNLKLFFSGCVHVFEEGYNFCAYNLVSYSTKVCQIFIQRTIKILFRKKLSII